MIMIEFEKLDKMNKRKNDMIAFMENLVHKRATKKYLEEFLSSYFNKPISLVEDTNDFDEDYRFSFYIEDEELGEVLFEIWYLIPRKSEKLYITEVGYDFACVGSYF
jgi:hypothetical protein